MSLSDKIINGIMGTNIRTIKVSVEQLAQIVNETIIAATTNEEELRAIEKAIKGSHFFISGDLESSDGKFLFHISLYQRSLKHRTVWVKNLQTEEIFEWNGFSLGPFKRAMQPYLVNARMHPPISWYRDQIIQDAVNAMDGDPAEAQDPAEAYDSEEMSESIPNETAFYEPFNKPMPMPRRQNPAVIGVITVVVLIVIGVAASMYEENMKEKQAAMEAKFLKELTPKAQKAREELEGAKAFLASYPEQTAALSVAAKRKRSSDRTRPAYRWVALAIIVGGIVCGIYGIYELVNRDTTGLYFTLLGLAAAFLFSGTQVIPTAKNNKKAVTAAWNASISDMEAILPGDFPVPARYAHPIVLDRMIRVLREGRAQSAKEALAVVKEDLKKLNADVQVEQEEYDEVVAIKPMFLLQEYK